MNAPAVELARLRRRIDCLIAQERSVGEWLASYGRSFARSNHFVPGGATAEGTGRLFELTPGFYRPSNGLYLSAIGIGTSAGRPTPRTDVAYARAIVAALRAGANVVDTASNYRNGRSERAVGAGLRVFLDSPGADRSRVLVASKGGFIASASDRSRAAGLDEMVAGRHCLQPEFLEGEVSQSRWRLGVDVIDIYFLHNPEYQLRAVSSRELQSRLRSAFGFLERKVAEGSIGRYGVATWSGLWDASLTIKGLMKLALDVAGADHHLQFAQLPFNRKVAQLTMRNKARPILEAAESGVGVLTSATLSGFDATVPVARPRQAIRFACNTEGVTTALIGMRREEHVAANFAAASV